MGTTDGGLTTSVSTTELVLEKYKVKKDLMLAPIPLELLLVLSPMHGLKELVKVWKNFPDELKVQREALVQKFKELTADKAYRARMRYLKIQSYEELRNSNPTVVEERPPPRDPEDENEIYRVFAAPLKVSWIPLHEREPKTCCC